MIVVPLPSLADELDRLPLRWSDPAVTRTLPRPNPRDFDAAPPPRPAPRPKSQADRRRDYMREYMRLRYRGRIR